MNSYISSTLKKIHGLKNSKEIHSELKTPSDMSLVEFLFVFVCLGFVCLFVFTLSLKGENIKHIFMCSSAPQNVNSMKHKKQTKINKQR